MLDKNDDELLDKEEVKDAFELVFMFYNQHQGWEEVKKRPPPPKPRDGQPLLKLFDEIDEDSCGLAARLELKRSLQDLMLRVPEVESFLALVSKNGNMLVEKDDYLGWVSTWVNREE